MPYIILIVLLFFANLAFAEKIVINTGKSCKIVELNVRINDYETTTYVKRFSTCSFIDSDYQSNTQLWYVYSKRISGGGTSNRFILADTEHDKLMQLLGYTP